MATKRIKAAAVAVTTVALVAIGLTSQPIDEELELSQVFLPLVQTSSGQDPTQPCRYIETSVELYWLYEKQLLGPYQVVDCLQHDKHWGKLVERHELVEVRDTGIWHLGIAQLGEQWLQVLVWHRQVRPYTLNLVPLP